MDSISSSRRSENMSRIRSCDTRPEMQVRRLLHGIGYRYVLHRRDLPGVPDLVFPSRRKIVLVQGCFWHLHKGCIDGRIPKSRVSYWKTKLEGNVERDRLNISRLRHGGWKVMLVWECQTAKLDNLRKRLTRFLGPSGKKLKPNLRCDAPYVMSKRAQPQNPQHPCDI
ncbi:MAG: DNA mismatch endonuclease Vsr [Candidatus Sulfotelmatobacter sp.]